MQKTQIEWADFSSNPIRAINKLNGKRFHFCTKVSAGCANCYSEAINLRFGNGLRYTKENEKNVEFVLDEKELDKIVNSRAPEGSRIFLCDMTDPFHPLVPFKFMDAILAATMFRPDLTFQLLTKRSGRMLEYFARNVKWQILSIYGQMGGDAENHEIGFNAGWPLENLHLGVSIENQKEDWRVKNLLECPAAKRFVSYEPAIAPVDFDKTWLDESTYWCPECNNLKKQLVCSHCGEAFEAGEEIAPCPACNHGTATHTMRTNRFNFYAEQDCTEGVILSHLDWVICGCESGASRRPCKIEWIRSVVEQCKETDTPCFVKQIEIDGKVSHNMADFPEDLRVQETIK